jgi:hypothetical protein
MMKILLTFFIAVLYSTTGFAQIPNAGFEDWDSTAGYKVPVGWGNLNSLTDTASVYTCVRNTPGYSGDFYVNLVSKNLPGRGVLPGMAVSGVLDVNSRQPVSGFPFSLRPQVLAGQWQYMAFPPATDQGYIAVLLSKWNTGTSSRDTIAFTHYTLVGMVMSWAPFMIPLDYLSAETPDSAMIVLSASGTFPVENSFLWVDDLVLADSNALGIKNIAAAGASANLFPNPATESATLIFSCKEETRATLSLSDITGRIIRSRNFRLEKGNNELRIDLSGLAKGMYFVKIFDGTYTEEKKLMVE